MVKAKAVASLFALLFIVGGVVHAETVRPDVVAVGLEHPWAVAFLPQGRFLVTERPGRMRVIEADGRVDPPIAGVPRVAVGGQGGLLDLVLDSDFARNRTLYFCFVEPAATGAASGIALARARLSEDRTRLDDLRVIFRAKPKVVGTLNLGCRVVEGGRDGRSDGTLFLTIGDRFSYMHDAQTLDNDLGKIARVAKDGSIPQDNPFVGRPGALPEIWSYGHRNPQGLAYAPDGTLWEHEHGPQGGDEINLIAPGRNYGWPVITYGEQYGGGKIGEGITAKAGMEQPLHYWTPSIAPSGMTFLTSDRYGSGWRGNLFIGSLKFRYLDRIELSEPFKGRVVREHRLLTPLDERIRDVRQGPDGLLYLLTDNENGRLIRLLPQSD
jgi:glucose/arabinose dehydrogenase